MIITIDGPTASGKSTVARQLSVVLGYYYIGTGTIFRGVGYVALTYYEYKGIVDRYDVSWVEQLLSSREFCYEYDLVTHVERLWYKNEDISVLLRNVDVANAASQLSSIKVVRDSVERYIKKIAYNYNNFVIDGRDAGSVLFPDAAIKIFLTADERVRIERWRSDQVAKGINVTYDDGLHAVRDRDQRDLTRTISPLIVPPLAWIIDSSDMSIEQVVALIVARVNH